MARIAITASEKTLMKRRVEKPDLVLQVDFSVKRGDVYNHQFLQILNIVFQNGIFSCFRFK